MTDASSPALTFRVNGRQETLSAGPGDRLLDLLRDDLRLIGGKDGCATGDCLACLVLVNGEPRRACQVAATDLAGATVTTAEGLARTGHLTAVQRAVLASASADPGGYRSPGLAIAATALLAATPDADDLAIATALAPHLGLAPGSDDPRLTDLVAAIRSAEGVGPGDPPPSAAGPGRVTGGLQLAGDIVRPGMLHATLVRASRGPGRIIRIDTDAARATDGVVAVVVGRDLLDVVPYAGTVLRDAPLLAIDRVRWAGEPFAAVLASSPVAARAAAALVRLELDTSSGYPGSTDADPIHLTDLLTAGPFAVPSVPVLHEENVVARHVLAWGTPEIADETAPPLEAADVSHFTDNEPNDWRPWFGYRRLTAHRRLDGGPAGTALVATSATVAATVGAGPEPDAAVAEWDGERLEVWSTCADPFAVRADLASLFSLPLAQVRVVTPALGGPHVAPGATTLEGIAAALARRVRRPVRLQAFPGELGWRGPDGDVRIDDRIVADGSRLERAATLRIFAGAAVGDLPRILPAIAGMIAGPWRWSALRVEVVVEYTTQAPLAAPLSAWAGPLAAMSHGSLAEFARAGHDPAALQARFLRQPGESLWPNGPALGGDSAWPADLLARVSPALVVVPPPGPTRAMALVRLDASGIATVAIARPALGDGLGDPLAASVAEALGIAPAMVRFAPVDTGLTPWGDARDAAVIAAAVEAAVRQVRERLLAVAAATLGGDANAVVLGGGEARLGERRTAIGALVAPRGELAAFGEAGDEERWGPAEAGIVGGLA